MMLNTIFALFVIHLLNPKTETTTMITKENKNTKELYYENEKEIGNLLLIPKKNISTALSDHCDNKLEYCKFILYDNILNIYRNTTFKQCDKIIYSYDYEYDKKKIKLITIYDM